MEIKVLLKELEKLTGPSIPRKKLGNAKTTDAFNSILKTMQDAVNGNSELGFDDTVKYVFENAGSILIDGRSGAIEVSSSDAEASLSISMSIDTFKKLQTKELEPMAAMGSGLMKLDGNMGLMMTTGKGVMKAISEAFKK